MMDIAARRPVETFRMRSVEGGYPGDWVQHWSRRINGKKFEFSRVEWADKSVTIRAWPARSAIPLHEWHFTLR